MTPLEKLVRLADAPESEYSWASVALGRAEAVEVVDYLGSLEDRLDAAMARVAELEAGAGIPRRCADCGRSARNLVAVPDDGAVVYLGPSCYQRRRVRGATAEALPIGGAW